MNRFANKSKFSPFYALLQLPGISINTVHIETSSIVINAQIIGVKERYFLSNYLQGLTDIPEGQNERMNK